MKYAKNPAKRVTSLKGLPYSKFDPLHAGITLKEMRKEDERAEKELASLYKQAIQFAEKQGDFNTKCLLENILFIEEKPLDKFVKLLVGMTKPFAQP